VRAALPTAPSAVARTDRSLVALADQRQAGLSMTVPDNVEFRAEPVPSLGPRGGPCDSRRVREAPPFREDEDLHAMARRPDLRERPPLLLAPERDPIPVHPHHDMVAALRRSPLQAREPLVDQLAGLARFQTVIRTLPPTGVPRASSR
jgi:hypothetical protein